MCPGVSTPESATCDTIVTSSNTSSTVASSASGLAMSSFRQTKQSIPHIASLDFVDVALHRPLADYLQASSGDPYLMRTEIVVGLNGYHYGEMGYLH